MPSLKSRFLYLLLKHRHLMSFQLKRETWDFNTSVPLFRQQCEKGAARFGRLPEGIEVSPVTVDGLRAEWILPARAVKDRVIFYIHGGGYVSGSCSDHRVHVAKFVKGSGVAALQFEYRLAPEHPFPAAIEDSVKAYRWLLDQEVSPARIVFAGDSAGGGLCLATMLALKDQGIPLPAAAVALSPWTDLKCTGASYKTNAGSCLSPDGMWTVCSKHYTGNSDPRLPYISPLYGDLNGLPPLLIYAGDDEILLDDSVRFSEKARAAGVDVTLKVGEGMMHCYPVMSPLFPEATQAMDHICSFIKKSIDG